MEFQIGVVGAANLGDDVTAFDLQLARSPGVGRADVEEVVWARHVLILSRAGAVHAQLHPADLVVFEQVERVVRHCTRAVSLAAISDFEANTELRHVVAVELQNLRSLLSSVLYSCATKDVKCREQKINDQELV